MAASVLSSGPAHAYCRTSVCHEGIAGKLCTPPQAGDCGRPLAWARRCIGFSVQQDASSQVDWETADAIVTQAFTTWEDTDCGAGGLPSIEVEDLGPVQCNAREYNPTGGNANIIVFRDGAWPYGGQSTLALTTVTYNLDTGEIYDADLEVNSADVTLTTGDTDVVYDLLSIVTHETGHILGLAHSAAADATMTADYRVGDTSLRDLDEDDITAICAAYPPKDPDPRPCDPTPRHGFKSTCGPWPEEEDDGCSLSRRSASDGLAGLLLLMSAAAWGRRRHQRHSAPPPR